MNKSFPCASSKFVIPISIAAAILMILVTSPNISFGITYNNHTSEKYQIQFQYPSTWQVDEKMDRFDEGVDVQIRDPVSYAFVFILYTDDLIAGYGSTDLTTAVYDSFKRSMDDYSTDYDIIEQPSFNSTVGGKKAGTFVLASKDKFEEYAQRWGSQKWIIFNGDKGYLMSYNALAGSFDSPENQQIREQLIKSIKFLGQENAININMTNTNLTKLDRFAE